MEADDIIELFGQRFQIRSGRDTHGQDHASCSFATCNEQRSAYDDSGFDSGRDENNRAPRKCDPGSRDAISDAEVVDLALGAPEFSLEVGVNDAAFAPRILVHHLQRRVALGHGCDGRPVIASHAHLSYQQEVERRVEQIGEVRCNRHRVVRNSKHNGVDPIPLYDGIGKKLAELSTIPERQFLHHRCYLQCPDSSDTTA